METKLLTLNEVADVLRVKPCTVYKYTSCKEIPHIKLGNRVLFDPVEIRDWIDSHKQATISKEDTQAPRSTTSQ